jgi:uncharacterized membrane protein YgcG
MVRLLAWQPCVLACCHCRENMPGRANLFARQAGTAAGRGSKGGGGSGGIGVKGTKGSSGGKTGK